MKTAKLKSFFGAWVVCQGEVMFPQLFVNKKDAQNVANHINERIIKEGI